MHEPLRGQQHQQLGNATSRSVQQFLASRLREAGRSHEDSPDYASNTIFWQSRETHPGDSVLMSGAFTNAAKTVRLVAVPDGLKDRKTLLKLLLASSITVPATNMSSTRIAFKIPTSMSAGVYAYQIQDPTANTLIGLVNQPEITWAQGVAPSTSVEDSLTYHVVPCGAEAGGVLRVFGKNFVPGLRSFLQDSRGLTSPVPVSQQDENSISLKIPAELPAGDYDVWLGTHADDVASSKHYKIKIHPWPWVLIQQQSCEGLVGDGKADNTAALQGCLDNSAGIASDPKHIVALKIPAGNFVITGGISLHPHEYLVGQGLTSTTITGVSTNPPNPWIAGTQYFGVANLTLTAPLAVNPNTGIFTARIVSNMNSFNPAAVSYDPATVGHVVVNNVFIAGGTDYSSNQQRMIGVVGPDIQILNSQLTPSAGGAAYLLVWTDGSWVSNNTINLEDDETYFTQSSQNQICEHNTISALTTANSPANIEYGGLGNSSAYDDPSEITRNIYYGYNSSSNMTHTNDQAITTDGGQVAYYGTTASSSGALVTLAYPPDWNRVGNSNFQTLILSVIAGTGLGQYRFLEAVDGETVQLQSPLAVAIDSTSVVAITQVNANFILAHNNFNTLTAESILLYGLGREFAIENNSLVNGGLGIGIAAYGPYFTPLNYQHTMNVEVLDNSITGTPGDPNFPASGAQSTGIYIQAFQGSVISGLLIKGNTISSPQDISFTNGWNNDTSLLLEENEASYLWDITWVIPCSTCTPQIRAQGVNY
jgi:hypothetical protein